MIWCADVCVVAQRQSRRHTAAEVRSLASVGNNGFDSVLVHLAGRFTLCDRFPWVYKIIHGFTGSWITS